MNFIRNLKIGTRLGAAFTVLLVLIASMATVGFIGANKLFQESKTIYENRTVPLAQLGDINYLVQRNRVLVMDMLINPSPDVIKMHANEMRGNASEIGKLWSAYMSTYLSAEEKVLAETFAQARAAYLNEGLLPISSAMTAGDMAAARDIYSQKVEVLAPRAQEAVVKLIQLQSDVAAQEFRRAEELNQTIDVFMVTSVVIALLLGVILAVFITHSISSPLKQAIQLTEMVASGDLTAKIEVRGRDELAQLLGALKDMNQSLAKVVGDVLHASESVAIGSTEIANGAADLSQRTEQQASNLEETAASMEELTVTVSQNSDTARQASQIASGACAAATRGGERVVAVVQTMEDISSSSRRISDIIGVIDGISFQTNILALNAAVEAARAGEQGRGFAVVAGEVRTLAQRSASAAKEIKELINSSVERVAAGSQQVTEASVAMKDIVSQVQRVTDLINEISAAGAEQSSGISQVGDAVAQLDQVTQQNAALVEESAAAAESLKLQAEQLKSVVGVFKLSTDNVRLPSVTEVGAIAEYRKTSGRPAYMRVKENGRLPSISAPVHKEVKRVSFARNTA